MNPASQEERECRPFAPALINGRPNAGYLLEKTYLPPFLNEASVYLMNAARCSTGTDNPPRPKHYSTCFPLYTEKDLRSVAIRHLRAPRFLVCLGGDVFGAITRMVFGKEQALRAGFATQGAPISLWGGWSLFGTYHPAGVLRNRNYIHPVADHLTLLHRVLKGDIPTATPPDREDPHHAPPR